MSEKFFDARKMDSNNHSINYTNKLMVVGFILFQVENVLILNGCFG